MLGTDVMIAGVVIIVLLLCGIIPALAGIIRYENQYRKEFSNKPVIVDTIEKSKIPSKPKE